MSLFSTFNAKILLRVEALVSGAIVLSPVQAGSVTSESIWDEDNALQRAQESGANRAQDHQRTLH